MWDWLCSQYFSLTVSGLDWTPWRDLNNGKSPPTRSLGARRRVGEPDHLTSGLWGWVLKCHTVRLKGRNSSHPAPDLQIVHLGPWHRKDLHLKRLHFSSFHLSFHFFIFYTDILVPSRLSLWKIFLPIWLFTDHSEGRKYELDSSSVKESENTWL